MASTSRAAIRFLIDYGGFSKNCFRYQNNLQFAIRSSQLRHNLKTNSLCIQIPQLIDYKKAQSIYNSLTSDMGKIANCKLRIAN